MAENLVLALFLAIPLALAGAMLGLARWLTRVPLWMRVLAFNVVVLLFLLSLVMVAGECYYRFIYDESDAVNYSKISRRWFQRYSRENTVGFRDDIEYVPEKPPGKRRISFLGDSFLGGHGIKAIEDRFPNLIRAAHPEWEIHVLSGFGLDTGDEMKMMANIFNLGYQTDEVVLVYCLNDVTDLMPVWQDRLYKINIESKKQNWLLGNSYLVNTLYFHLKAAHDPLLKDYFGFIMEGYQGELWKKQTQRLQALRDLVESHGARFAVVTFPFVHAVGPNYPFRSAHDRLNEIWAVLKVPHLDLLPVYSNLPPASITVNRYDPHPNELANRLAAEKVDPFLREQMKDYPK
jgi:hypothetical protein